jgi:two-component system CheB/CheR fusion protein
LRAEGSWTGELTQRTKDGRVLTVESRLQLETFGDQRLVLESTHDVTERKVLENRQRLLLNELGHRVNNTLAVVQAIAHRTAQGGPNGDFVETFDGRIAALARAHRLLMQSNWEGADLYALARSQLEPYMSDKPNGVRIAGAPVLLPTDLATPFGLVLHELATNAAKHGSLSGPDGAVDLTWTVGTRDSRRALSVVWQEENGVSVTSPKRTGLGSALIEHAIPGAAVKREFLPKGLICTIEVPLKETPQGGSDGGPG